MCAGVVLYHVLLELSERDRVSGRSGPENGFLGKGFEGTEGYEGTEGLPGWAIVFSALGR